ncbi:MAG: hypothetical protein RR893_07055 [Clostridia bacterium]
MMPIEVRYNVQKQNLEVSGVRWSGERNSGFLYLSQSPQTPSDSQLAEAIRNKAFIRTQQESQMPWYFAIPQGFKYKNVYAFLGFCDCQGQLIINDLCAMGPVFCGFYDIQYQLKKAKNIGRGLKHVVLQVNPSVNLQENMLRYIVDEISYSVPVKLSGNQWNDLNGFEMLADASLRLGMCPDIPAENYKCR